jgi:ankyrin repeat protein
MAAAGVGWLATTNRRGIDLTANKAATPDPHEAESETLDAVKLAIELGGDVNAVNLARETALFGAVSRGFAPVVQFLAEHRARLDVRNKRGQSLLALTAPRTQTSGTPQSMLDATAVVLRGLGVKE